MKIIQWIALACAIVSFGFGLFIWWLFAKEDGDWGIGRLIGLLVFVIFALFSLTLLGFFIF